MSEIVRIMDPLTQSIGLLRPHGLRWKELRASRGWSIELPPNDGVVFCLVERGRCLFKPEGTPASDLAAGDFVLMAMPSRWMLGDADLRVATPLQAVRSHADRAVGLPEAGDGDAATRIWGGHFRFDRTNGFLMRDLLPSICVVSARDPCASRLRSVIDLVAGEAAADRPGKDLALERLLELLLLEAVRHGGAGAPGERPGLLAGLADRRLSAALRAMHADVGHGWTVAGLADVAGLSRSAFSARFSRAVGLAPVDYLLRWRVALAKDALRSGGRSLAELAFDCGYGSTRAFSSAFARVVGCSPRQYAKRLSSADR